MTTEVTSCHEVQHAYNKRTGSLTVVSTVSRAPSDEQQELLEFAFVEPKRKRLVKKQRQKCTCLNLSWSEETDIAVIGSD